MPRCHTSDKGEPTASWSSLMFFLETYHLNVQNGAGVALAVGQGGPSRDVDFSRAGLVVMSYVTLVIECHVWLRLGL